MTNQKIAIFPGSFNVFHSGHLDIILRGLNVFNHVVILVANNPYKENLPIEKRLIAINQFLNQAGFNLDNNPNISIAKCDGNVANFAKNKNIKFIIRGVRNVKDFKFEKYIGNVYKKQNNELEIVYFFAKKEYLNLSSSQLLKLKKQRK